MNKRGTGFGFCFIAAMLFLGRYLTAAIFGSGINSWNSKLFDAMLQYVGTDLFFISLIALIVGVIYLVRAEIEERTK